MDHSITTRNSWMDRHGVRHRYVDHDGNVIPPERSWSTPIDLRPIFADLDERTPEERDRLTWGDT